MIRKDFLLAGSFELEVTVADELSSDTVSLELDSGCPGIYMRKLADEDEDAGVSDRYQAACRRNRWEAVFI